MQFHNQTELFNMFEKNNLDQTREMSTYPSLLTPPSESPETVQVLPASPNSEVYLHSSSYLPHYNMAPSTDFISDGPFLKIIEQPVDKFRFRYKSEMAGTHGSLTGRANDRSRRQTYPTIQLCNFNKPAIVRCSVYQQAPDDFTESQPHAHKLIRKCGSTEFDDPHDIRVSAENGYIAGFHSMGIIHTARKNIVTELIRKKQHLKEEEIAMHEAQKRDLNIEEMIEIMEPIKRKKEVLTFADKLSVIRKHQKGAKIQTEAENESKKINLNIVRLRFDAFEERNGILYPICSPVYSNPINNLKSAQTGDLKIVRMDHCTSPCRGNKEIFILVEKVTKKNIKIRFFELDDEEIVWEDYGKFTDLDVHHQYAIVFKTPPYKSLDIDRQVKVFMELVRPSDGARSEPKEFTYVPCDPVTGRKRARTSYNSGSSYSSLYGSNEIPLTVSGFMDMEVGIRSEDLEEALERGDVRSSEVEKLLSIFGKDYKDLLEQESNMENYAPDSSARYRKIAAASGMGESVDIKHLNINEKKIIEKVYKELKSFLLTNPPDDRKIKMAYHLFEDYRTEKGDTPFHLALYAQSEKVLKLLIQLLYTKPEPSIINARNNKGDTHLHVAVQMGIAIVVGFLFSVKADVSIQNNEGNTPLHLIVKQPVNNDPRRQSNMHNILNYLLRNENESELKKFIELENNAGDTALTIAIENNNFEAVKKLCWRGADINKHHKKNGYTALHMAVERQNYEIVNFLLENNDIQLQINDFKDCTPYRLAMSLKDSSRNAKRICDRIEECMKIKGASEFIEIKEECVDVSDEEEIKLEPMSPEDSNLENNFPSGISFTPECLDEVARILDKSGNWNNLADLLDLSHILRVDDIVNYKSPSKSLLNLAIANGESVNGIREFLEHLGEMEAVQAIDRMIKTERED